MVAQLLEQAADLHAECIEQSEHEAGEWNGPGTGSRPSRGAPLDLKALAAEWYH
jgi:hypothetical protein